MMALGSAVYLSSLGKEGFREAARQNLLKAHYAFEQLLAIPGVKPLFKAPFFNEFALDLPMDPEKLNQQLFKEGFLGGLPLKRWYPELPNGWLVCVTEARSKGEIDRFAEAVGTVVSDRR
jgi:glycine dehydrogenase subunit 1